MKKLLYFFIFVFTICFVYEKRLALAQDTHSPSPCLTIVSKAEAVEEEGVKAAGVALPDLLWTQADTVARETNATLILRVRFFGARTLRNRASDGLPRNGVSMQILSLSSWRMAAQIFVSSLIRTGVIGQQWVSLRKANSQR